MRQKINLDKFINVTGRDPWKEINYRAVASFRTAIPTQKADGIFCDYVHMMLKKDKEKEESRLIDAAITQLFYNMPKSYLVHGITRELINYAALSAPFRDEHAKKVYDAITEEIQASVGVTVPEESVNDYLCMFAKNMKESMETIQYEFLSAKSDISLHDVV